MSDPMDAPPADHGSDRYDYVEVNAAAGIVPSGPWWDQIVDAPCPDCRANVFAKHLDGDPALAASWHVTYAHDDTCPTITAIEQGAT